MVVWEKETPLPSEALEMIADVLLMSLDKDKTQPVFSESQLERKRRRAARVEECVAPDFPDGYAMTDIAEVDELLNDAHLSDREKSAWKMRFEGYCVSEIARSLQVSSPTVERLLRSAEYRIRSMKQGFFGFNEVYYGEIHKFIYRRPSHCFEQPCRKLGYCRYAHMM
jgi:DNA-binding CsgD family transcriptional regulator